MKKHFYKNTLRTIYRFYIILKKEYYFNPCKYIIDVSGFIKEYRIFLKDKNPKYKISINYILPYLKDNTEKTSVEPVYFFQDTWAAKKIFQSRPKHHYDIGSAYKTVGIISQFVPTTMIDIRPIDDISLDNLFFVKGSILNLPFKDNSIESLSSLCVVEHIGLGRYGDAIDPYGSERAIKELKRILKKGGDLYFSVHVDKECRVYFNAHRAFTRSYILELFNDLKLIEEKYIYGKKMYDNYDKSRGFGTGLFHFCKK